MLEEIYQLLESTALKIGTSEIGLDLARQGWKDSDGAFWCLM